MTRKNPHKSQFLDLNFDPSARTSFNQASRKEKPAPRNALRRVVLGGLLATTMLTVLPQIFPSLVSQPLADYMADKGYAPTAQEHFHAKETRVYHRHNPLVPFHMAGMNVRKEMSTENDDGIVRKSINSMGGYLEGLLWGGHYFLKPVPLDAFSIPTQQHDLESRVNFIRPPSDFTAQEWLRDMLHIDVNSLNLKHSEQDVAKALHQFIMLHEARHGDQDHSHSTALTESDADRYAIQVMALRGETQPALLEEVYHLVTSARHVRAITNATPSHGTGMSLMRPTNTPEQMAEDISSYERLSDVLLRTARNNRYPREADATFIYYANAVSLLGSGRLDASPHMRETTEKFVQSVEYLNKSVNGSIIVPGFDYSTIRLPDNLDLTPKPTTLEHAGAAADKHYKSAPDKLPPRGPKPSV